MRDDAIGLFWEDRPAIRETKPPEPKREPPPRTWEEPGYLPGLAEAQAFPVRQYSIDELAAAQAEGEPLLFDSEVYANYYLAAFRGYKSGRVFFLEMREGEQLDVARLRWIFENFLIVGFNSEDFDLPIAALALSGMNCAQLKEAVNKIIVQQIKHWIVLRSAKVKPLQLNHVDLIEVCPLQASLKIYGGRIHAPRMQELPFHPETILSEEQIAIVRWYCINSDLTNTAYIYKEVLPNIELREQMSQLYGVDLRSKSDAQLAETVVNAELTRKTSIRPQRPKIEPGTIYQYKTPAFIQYALPQLQHALSTIQTAQFVVGENGGIIAPPEVEELKFTIGNATYQMGIGGLHSTEKKIAHFSDEEFVLLDRDVASYYPAIILNQGLFPAHLGESFLEVYRSLVERRLLAKKEGRKIEADMLKIVVNGIFGKLGSKWSTLYAPDLMLQVTITGQLAMLMLIEWVENNGIEVCSGNTDGFVSRCPRDRADELRALVLDWEKFTGFTTEETIYRAMFCRDVNNYVAVKHDGKVKFKGEYCELGSANNSRLSKNPTNLICNDAVAALLTKGTPLRRTIDACKDVRRFVTVRTVNGGAVKDGVYYGKAIRWYYSKESPGEIIKAQDGHFVPRSEGARPCLDLPAELPPDLDFEWYEREAAEMVTDLGWRL